MKTINISVTGEQYSAIDNLVKEKGYANRSEFFRSLLRFAISKPQILADTEEFKIEAFKKRPLAEIEKGFRDTGLYSEEFIADLIDGLKDSPPYATKKSR
jgi:Arc/MetJ-type ribon-helix-helix transcriptional regulator